MHNHGVTNNTVPGNCWGDTFRSEQEPFSYAAYLKQYGGYKTFHAGKYLNQYGKTPILTPYAIPTGWDSWYSLADDIKYYDYCISNMGQRECYGHDPTDYHTTMIKVNSFPSVFFTFSTFSCLYIQHRAMEFLQETKESDDNDPFLMVFSTIGCHSPFTVEPKYQGMNMDVQAPRTPNWNIVADEGSHHDLLTIQQEMDDRIIQQSDQIFAMRLGTLRSVDDAIGDIYRYIDVEMDALDETYFIYASDHGYHDGQWAMSYSKMQLYETDIRIPFYMNGPTIPKGADTNVFATTIDIAPTILDIAGIEEEDAQSQMDGKSLLDYVEEDAVVGVDEWQVFLIEYEGEGFDYDTYKPISANMMGIDETVTDGWNNTYSCLRWMNSVGSESYKYCTFKCFGSGHIETECAEGSVEAKGEFYDLVADPWEMKNIYDELTDGQHQILMDRLEEFVSCEGDECRELYNRPIDFEEEAKHKHKHFFSFYSLLL